MEQRSTQSSQELGVLLFRELPRLEAIERGARESLQRTELIRREIDHLLSHVFQSPASARLALEEADRSAVVGLLAREPERFGTLRRKPVRGRFGLWELLGFTSDQEACECAEAVSWLLRDLQRAEDHAARMQRRIEGGDPLTGAAAIIQEVQGQLEAVHERLRELRR